MDADLLPALFARQAARTPQAPAVIDDAGPVSYAALDDRSDRLARALLAAGAKPESLVAVSLPRSVDLVVAFLAAWKCGAAYVPLDPGYPPERLRWILADTGAELFVASRDAADAAQIAERPGLRTIVLDGGADDPLAAGDDAAGGGARNAQPSAALPSAVLTRDSAAYAIYTSGSTGRPKGVVISHGAIANRIMWTVNQHSLASTDRVVQRTSVSFDAAGWEIFAPLVSGGAVVLPPAGADRDPALLLRAIARFGVTVLQVVPSLLRLAVDEEGWEDCGSLRLLLSAGEPLDAELCRRFRQRSSAHLWNTYGPTECAIDVTAHQVNASQVSGRVPIGRPIANVRVLVLDQRDQPAPIGMPGELCVGGVAVARGYLGLPGLTAERFVPDPYGPAGARMYRTGDRVRWRHDETLEYLSRLDDQVKVNGVRIEPGEVEAALLTHAAVRAAVVLARQRPDGTNRLVAYVVSRDDELAPNRLRQYLHTKLPDPLVPSAFVPMRELPLLPSGKVNRSELPDPGDGLRPRWPNRIAPSTSSERMVAEVWSRLLDVDDVAVQDDFFQLGGSSLLLTKLAGRLSAVTGREIAVQDLFTEATVEAQARLIDEAAGSVPPVRAVPRGEPLPLSFQQNQLWFLEQMSPGNTEWVTPMAVRLPGRLTTETVRAALAALAARHEILRTRYVTLGGEPRQVIAEPGPVPLEVVAAGQDGDQLRRLVTGTFEQGFDLVRGPVWRALLVRGAGDDHTLMVAIHHIASDGWSSAVFAREMRELCGALADGREPALEPLPVQYADYAQWQLLRLTDEVLEPHVRFWLRQLEGVVPAELPTDRPRPPVRDPRGATVTFTVPAEAANGVTELGRKHGATPFMSCLTAFAALIGHWSGQWDVAVGVPVAGRTRPEVSGLIGAFLNMLVMRCRLTRDASFGDSIEQVMRMSRAAFAHQELPFEWLVDKVAPARDLSRTPLYQVMFNFLDEGETMGRDNLGSYESAWRSAKTDLTLFLYTGSDGAVTGVLEYATALFDEPTIARLADRFVQMLDAVAADPAATLAEAGASGDAPIGIVEERMAAIWARVLQCDASTVRMDQNFFMSGGNSRLALRVMAEVQDEFDLDLPVRLIFERPTVARLSAAVAERIQAEVDSELAAGGTPAKEL